MSKEKQCKCCKEYWWEMNIHSQSGLCPNCYDYVSDLEAKLAESEKRLVNCVDFNTWQKTAKENNQLKQQLAEKEKELSEALAKQAIICLNTIEKAYQDKISFAVEQLTEIREYVKECWGLDELEGKVRLDIAKKIRLKIEQLKEGK